MYPVDCCLLFKKLLVIFFIFQNKFVEFGPPTTIHEASRIIESWKIPDWVKVDDIEQFKSLCDIHCQNEEEVREMTELRRQLKDKKPERPVVLPIQNLQISKPKSEAETQTKDQIAKLDDLLTKKDGKSKNTYKVVYYG